MDDFGIKTDFASFDQLLNKDDLVEEPIPLERFVTDQRYLGMAYGLSPIQLELARHITQIYKPETLMNLYGEDEGMKVYQEYTVNEVVAMCGKGAGKDHTSRICFAYIVYLLHCLRDPLTYYGRGHGVTIDLLNLAVNSVQAQQVFFDPFKKLLMASPYFNEVGFEPRVREVQFWSRPIRCLSGHSESEGWEGYELHTVVLDEIAAFKTDAEIKGDSARAKGSASQIYDMSMASVQSRFGDLGKIVLLSFPRFDGDFITTRYNSALQEIENGETKVWALKAKTFDMNPTKTREDFDYLYRQNEVLAKARFECEPPKMEDAFFREPDRVRAAFYVGDNPQNADGTWQPWFNGSDGLDRYIHVDLGLKRDKAGLAMVHTSGMKEIQMMGQTEYLPIINMDLIYYWEAPVNEEINFSSIRQMILDLARKFNVAMVSFDYWQSADMMQSLRAAGLETDAFVVDKVKYDTLSTSIYDGRFRGYWNEVLVEDELLRLRIINQKKIDHPASGGKDGADAVAGATWNCFKYFDISPELNIEIWGDGKSAEYEEDMEQAENESPEREKWSPQRTVPEDIEEWLMEIL